MTTPNDSQTSGTQPTAPPSRRRKTHKNAEFTALLRDLPRAKKLARNREIEARNEQRAVSRAYRDTHPEETIVDGRYSSNESLITISDRDEDPPSSSQQARNFLAAMSPSSATAWVRKFIPKRARSLPEQSDEANTNLTSSIQRAKRHNAGRRPEVKIEDGEPPPPGFSTFIYELYSNDAYIPLSLFTNANLRIISREGSTLTFKKVISTDVSSKTARVLDTVAFEKAYGAEKDLSHSNWTQAAGNYLRFAQSLDDNDWYTRWFEHFNYLDGREDADENFEAIKTVDIKLRKDYSSNPFEFNKPLYRNQVENTIRDVEISKLKTANQDSHRLQLFSKFNRPKPAFGQPSSSRAPFQPRTGGDPSSATCVICAKKGHVFSSCQSPSFDDGKALFCKAEDGNLVSIKGKTSICRSWNIRGNSSTACENHAKDKRAHICSFCGKDSHHAFSWTCRRDPSKPSP